MTLEFDIGYYIVMNHLPPCAENTQVPKLFHKLDFGLNRAPSFTESV